jgi:hypothetical protein
MSKMKHENFFGIEEILGNIILNEIHTYIYIYIYIYTYRIELAITISYIYIIQEIRISDISKIVIIHKKLTHK